MFYEALNPQMWAIDPIGKPPPKCAHNEGTILEIDIATQKQFMYLLKSGTTKAGNAAKYEQDVREFDLGNGGTHGRSKANYQEVIFKNQQQQ